MNNLRVYPEENKDLEVRSLSLRYLPSKRSPLKKKLEHAGTKSSVSNFKNRCKKTWCVKRCLGLVVSSSRHFKTSRSEAGWISNEKLGIGVNQVKIPWKLSLYVRNRWNEVQRQTEISRNFECSEGIACWSSKDQNKRSDLWWFWNFEKSIQWPQKFE